MMNDLMTWGGGAMMWGMGLYGVLVIVLLVLAIAALIKYLRSGVSPSSRRVQGLCIRRFVPIWLTTRRCSLAKVTCHHRSAPEADARSVTG